MKQRQQQFHEAQQCPVALANQQRTHNLYIFSNAKSDKDEAFRVWYLEECLQAIFRLDGVLSCQLFERQDYDISDGISIDCDFDFVTVCELGLDGAEQAAPTMDNIVKLFRAGRLAQEPALWLFYPVSEKVGRPPDYSPFISLAFAAPVKGLEAEFREWYSTGHIRHALNIPTYVSSQRFELTEFQQPGAAAASYESLAVYEQEGCIDDIVNGLGEAGLAGLGCLTPSKNSAMDLERFAEWVFYPLTEKLQDLSAPD